MTSDLVGRRAELERIDSLLERSPGAHPALLLRGDRGIGKTALLDTAAARAAAGGLFILRAFGAEFEAGLAFSALHQLLYPLRNHVDRLPGPHRQAIRQVLDLVPGLPPNPLVPTAVLHLLSEVAAERPLLLIVDDVVWIDPASATTLGFVARRLGHDPIVFLATARTGADALLDQLQLPELVIAPLDVRSAVTFLDLHWPGLAAPVRRRTLADAAGNPLVLRELPALLDDRQRSGLDPLPEFLPLSWRLQATFAEQFRTLPEATRGVLLAAALEPDLNPAALKGPAAVEELAPAVRAGLVHTDGRRVWFPHPLIRSAIVHQTPAGERRVAHQGLAEAMAGFPERRAWHLAEAAPGPDEAVARALDHAAMSAWRRSEPSAEAYRELDPAAIRDRRRAGAATAVTALIRAAELSPHAADRSRRLIEAASLANLTGQLDEVPRLLADAGQAPDTPTGLVFATTAHLLTNQEGDVDAAYRLLTQALDALDRTAGNDRRWDSDGILYALLLVSLYSLQPEPWELLDKAMAWFAPEAVIPFRLCHDAYVDPSRTADAVREGLAQAFAALPSDAAPWQLMPLAFAAVAMDVMSDYRYLVTRMIDRERDGGAVAMVIPGLMLLCHDSYVHGQWDEAERLAQEGLDLAAVYGYHFWEGQIRALLSSGAALRGNADLSRSRRTETTNWAAPRGMGVTEAYARSAGNLAAMGRGDFEEALVQAARVTPPGAPSAGIPGRWVVLDLVEAAVRSGHLDQARAHVAAARKAGLQRIGPRIALMITGAEALTTQDDQAGALYEAALAIPEAERWPWEHARVQFAYGQWLRRTHDIAVARVHLRAALETFERIGAEGFAQRVREELRAAGVAYAVQPEAAGVALTAQERQIAELAATGLTNKQIADRLFLSHRTVGSHLHRLYPKLGVASRTALRDALESFQGEE
ncbi:LuxR family transcriptional regulator [Streptomyces sp. SID13031]|uniref:ATP-binding protein n=1 Tax=Streptomyces sp. SID13031 TaxID=2706046 RepID=UPI0013C70808|nr:LuxR family transcriptional regulator [Streptomyces sp. SID13031]NEA30589.1 helix-turn-helix domain-containing protein [Streptomyces sp. SID13031]